MDDGGQKQSIALRVSAVLITDGLVYGSWVFARREKLRIACIKVGIGDGLGSRQSRDEVPRRSLSLRGHDWVSGCGFW